MKSIFASKVFWTNLISGLVMFLEGQQVIHLFPDNITPYVAALVFGLNIVLRYFTTTSVTVPGTPADSLRQARNLVAVLALGLAALAVTSCASTGGPRHVTTVSVVSAHGTLALTQDTEMALVCGRPTAPKAPQCVPEELHKELSGKLAQAFTWDEAVAKAVRDVPEGAALPSGEIGQLLGQISTVINFVLDHLPNTAQKDQLVAKIAPAK